MRYPSESVERMDQQWAETEDERNERLRRRRMEQWRKAGAQIAEAIPDGRDADNGEAPRG